MSKSFTIKKTILLFLFAGAVFVANAEDGYDLWMRYVKVSDNKLLSSYKKLITSPAVMGNSATIQAAKNELERGLRGLLQTPYTLQSTVG